MDVVYISLSCVSRSTSGGDRVRTESTSSQEASSRKDRHRPSASTKGNILPHMW